MQCCPIHILHTNTQAQDWVATCEPTIGDIVTLPGLALSSPWGCLVWFLFSTSLGWKAEDNNNNKLMFYAQSNSAVLSGRYTFCHHVPVSERGWHVCRVHTEFSYFNIPKSRPVSSKDQRLVGNANSASMISKMLLSALATGEIQHTTHQSKPGLQKIFKLNNLFFIFLFLHIYIYIYHPFFSFPFFPFFSDPPPPPPSADLLLTIIRKFPNFPRPWLKYAIFPKLPRSQKKVPFRSQTSKQCTNPGQSQQRVMRQEVP